MIDPALRKLAVPIDSVTPHPRNDHHEGDVGAIVLSLRRFGQVRPIVVQKSTGYVVAGNHVLAAMRAEGQAKVAAVVVEMDDDAALGYLIADNRTAELARYNDESHAQILTELRDAGLLEGTGYDDEDVGHLLADLARRAEDDGGYSQKVESPVYEPRGDRPPVADLADVTRRDELLAEIEAADVPADIRAFLILAAHRHTAFDYEAIAEFYAHADAHTQRLMEASALVVIDFDDAVERGFVRLNADLDEAFRRDYPDA